MLTCFPLFYQLKAQNNRQNTQSEVSASRNDETQEVKQRLRFGVKAGVPMMASFNCEYLTTALENRLAADLDFCYYTFKTGDASLNYSNFGLGANYYFFKPGRSLYGGLGYYRLGFFARQTLSTMDSPPIYAEGTGSLAFHNLNMKVGGKHGGGFYFRWELGLGLTIAGGDLYVRAKAFQAGQAPVFLEEKVTLPFNRFFLFNLGIGFAIL